MTSLRPMLASASSAASNRTPVRIESLAGTHVFDIKLDGIRAFLIWDSVRVWLFNRNDVDITDKYPDIVKPAERFFAATMPGQSLTLDGEIMALDGRFESVLTRDKQGSAGGVARSAGAIPVKFYAFDLPTDVPLPWTDRRRALDSLDLPDCIERTVWSEDPAFLEQTRALGLEGVIAKRKTSRYESGARSKSWVKFKNLHRITCLATGYAAGTGSRAHFGAMFLGLVDERGDIVPAGRVGTGMTGREIDDLKARLDRAEVLLVEIECLGLSSGNVLRMPVYRGIRTDVGVLDASTSQLATLPRS